MDNKKVFNNAKWIIVCKIIQSLMQLIIGMISARYLGPSNYGLINYANSIVAFALPIMKLGMDAVLVYELVKSPEKEGEIVGTSMLMNIASGIISIFGVFCFVNIANAGESETIVVCTLYSLSIFFAALEMIQYWFQYKLLSKYSSVIMLISYVIVSAYKIFLLITQKSVYWFAVTHSIEYGIIGIVLLIFYKKLNGMKLSFSFELAKSMFKRSKHYIIAALMVVVIQNTDHVMITFMCGKAENGFYSSAIQSAAVAHFVYVAIVDSFRPMILESKKNDQINYEKKVSLLYGIVIYMALAQAAVFTVLAEFIVGVLYGSEYVPAVPLLRVLVWYIAFSQMGVVRNVWILAEEKQKFLPWINIIGALSNVAVNFVLIPYWGALGASIASLFTQFFTNFVLGFIIKPIRTNNRLMLKGINPKFLFAEAKIMLRDFRRS